MFKHLLADQHQRFFVIDHEDSPAPGYGLQGRGCQRIRKGGDTGDKNPKRRALVGMAVDTNITFPTFYQTMNDGKAKSGYLSAPFMPESHGSGLWLHGADPGQASGPMDRL